MVMFVFCRRITTDSAKEMIKYLKKQDVPLLVCLTFADELYTEAMHEEKSDNPGPTDFKSCAIRKELEVSTELH